MSSLSRSIGRIRRSHAELGTRRFVIVNLGIFGWIAAGFYLFVAASWPAGCARDGFLSTYGCSFGLLSGGAAELALFAWLWGTPLLVVAAIAGLARARAR